MGLFTRLLIGKEAERRWKLLCENKRIKAAIDSDMLGEAEVEKLTDFVYGRTNVITWFGQNIDARQPTAGK